jgi:hypothetical protein
MVFPNLFKEERAVPLALIVVCVGMKCARFVRLSTTHIIVS